jgi:hypothetical protein
MSGALRQRRLAAPRPPLGGPADEHIRKAASEVVTTYLEHVVLKRGLHNPYVVGEVLVDPTTAQKFTNALHGWYSGLNKTLELPLVKGTVFAAPGQPHLVKGCVQELAEAVRICSDRAG